MSEQTKQTQQLSYDLNDLLEIIQEKETQITLLRLKVKADEKKFAALEKIIKGLEEAKDKKKK